MLSVVLTLLTLLTSTRLLALHTDGHELTILFTGSTDGAIWPCESCALDPLGGLARRATEIARLRRQNPGIVLVDAGDLLSARGHMRGDRKVLQVYEHIGYDAVNVGDQEFVHGRSFFQAELSESTIPLISASLLCADTGALLASPYTIKNANSMRVGILGLVDAQAFLMLRPDNHSGIRVATIPEALNRFLPEVRAKSDFVIILSHLGVDGDRDLAEVIPGLGIIIGGHSGWASVEPVEINGNIIVRPGQGGEYIGRLDLSLDSAYSLESYTHSLIPLTGDIPEDPAVAAMVEDVPLWEAGSQKQVMPSTATGRLFSPSAHCGACHGDALSVWQQQKHARAFDALPPERQGNLGCLPCHASGWGQGGYIDAERTPHLSNVNCTACHVVERKHLSWPEQSAVPEVTEDNCLRCHTASRSPQFDFRTYWEQIEH